MRFPYRELIEDETIEENHIGDYKSTYWDKRKTTNCPTTLIIVAKKRQSLKESSLNMRKKIKNFHEELKRIGRESKKSSIALYFTLRTLVILCMVLEFVHGDINNAMLCVLSLILLLIPFFIEKQFKIDLPNALEIIIMLFIFAAEILGEINNFYGMIPYWDTMLHTLNGFLAAGVGFALFDLLNKNSKLISLSPLFLSIVAFCFSMTIGVLWEFFEFSADIYFRTDMQKDRIVTAISSVTLNEEKKNVPIKVDNIEYTIIYSKGKDGETKETRIEDGYLDIGIIDTMKDLLVNFVGATVFSIYGYLYIKNCDKYKFVHNFIPKKIKDL